MTRGVQWPTLRTVEISGYAAIAQRHSQTASARSTRRARRLTDALASPRQSAVDGEIARVLAASGGHITDSMEREIMQKLLGSDWSLP
jgi:hypothetical protein